MPPETQDQTKAGAPAGAAPAAPAPAAPAPSGGEDFWGDFEREDAEAASLYQKSLSSYEANPAETKERLKLAMEIPLEDLRARKGAKGNGAGGNPPAETPGKADLEPSRTPADASAAVIEALGGREVVDTLQEVARGTLANRSNAEIQKSREEILNAGAQALKKTGGVFDVDGMREIASEMVVSRVVGGVPFDEAVKQVSADFVSRLNASADRIEIAKGEEGNRLAVTGSPAGLGPPNADFSKMSERQSLSWMEQALAAARRGVKF